MPIAEMVAKIIKISPTVTLLSINGCLGFVRKLFKIPYSTNVNKIFFVGYKTNENKICVMIIGNCGAQLEKLRRRKKRKNTLSKSNQYARYRAI